DLVVVLRWVSSQIEPTGPGASFASATNLSQSERPREFEHVRRRRRLPSGPTSCPRANRGLFYTDRGRPVCLWTNRRRQRALRCFCDGRSADNGAESYWFPNESCLVKNNCVDSARWLGKSR